MDFPDARRQIPRAIRTGKSCRSGDRSSHGQAGRFRWNHPGMLNWFPDHVSPPAPYSADRIVQLRYHFREFFPQLTQMKTSMIFSSRVHPSHRKDDSETCFLCENHALSPAAPATPGSEYSLPVRCTSRPSTGDFPAVEDQLDRAESQRRLAEPLAAPGDRLDAGEQFRLIERLGK